jgi:PAS domain S-box-containing protein
MGLTDGAHGVVPFGVAWSWLRHGATLAGGLLCALVWMPLPPVFERRSNLFMGGVAALSIAGAVAVSWKYLLLPAPFGPEGYTFAVIVSNALGGLGFVAAAVFFLRRYLRQPHTEELVFASLTLLFGIAGLLFGFSHLWAVGWWVWHGARLLAYGILVITAYNVFQAGEEQRRQLTTAVESERKRFKDVLDMLPAYVVLLSKDYQVPFANRYFEDRFGKSNGRRCYEYLFQRNQPCENCETFKVAQTHAPHHWEWTGPDARDYDIHDFPFTDRDGSTLIMEMGIDITESKRAAAALAASEQRYRSLIVATAQIVWTTNADGEVRTDMPMWREFTGQTVEQLQGWGWIESVHAADRERTATVWRQAVATRSQYEIEYRMRRQDGQYRDMWVRGVPVMEGGTETIREWVGTCTDITERKRAQEELKRYAAELERSNGELQDFASIASHDLQEPLRKVIAFGEHLREHLGDNLDELGQDFLARMQNAAQRMSGLIEALLDYSRVTTRAQPLQPVDLLAVVFGVLTDMAERIAATHARVEFGRLPKVMADPIQLRQLIQNLVANGLKFQAKESRPVVVIEGKANGDGRCLISVRDNGIGFDEKYLDRIFRPFQRLHGRSEYEGSGMGLAICRKIVARHGGTITAHSRPGEGSTFAVTLPAASLPAASNDKVSEVSDFSTGQIETSATSETSHKRSSLWRTEKAAS